MIVEHKLKQLDYVFVFILAIVIIAFFGMLCVHGIAAIA